MRIACPGCAAEYDVPDALLAAGPRSLRCRACGAEFRAELPAPLGAAPLGPGPAAPEPEPRVPEPPAAPPPSPPARDADFAPPPEAPHPDPAEDPPRPPPARGPRQHAPIDPPLPVTERAPEAEGGSALAAWAGSLLLLGTAAWLAYAWRGEIMAFWPASARLFQALGLG